MPIIGIFNFSHQGEVLDYFTMKNMKRMKNIYWKISLHVLKTGLLSVKFGYKYFVKE
jgi:hypothetical protein